MSSGLRTEVAEAEAELRKRQWPQKDEGSRGGPVYLVAEWTHFTFFGILLPTIKLKVHTFWGL